MRKKTIYSLTSITPPINPDMREKPTEVIFLWHMHQPCYKAPGANHYLLPWVRLHGIKDYYGMARILSRFDKAKAVFNFSGILLDQIADYAKHKAKDYYGILTLKKPEYLTRKEKKFIIDRFFSLNFERFIQSNKRYLQLYYKKMSKGKFSAQDIMDLQVIFNLSWFHPYTIKENKRLRELTQKGSGYTKTDKEYVINSQYDILTKIIPLYRKLIKEKRIEVSITPYAHPIMPLIYDTDILREFSYLKKPILRFSHPEDCRWHLKKSQDVLKRIVGSPVEGSWPSEGSVSEDVAKTYADEGFKWIGADEGILFKSLTTEFVSYDMIKNQRHLIYKPYNFRGLNLFFRDRNLSDAISFIYQSWGDPVFAASDLLEHFKRIHYYTRGISKDRVISIIMDGENAWEYYRNNGVDFLEAVYSAIQKSKVLSFTTPSEFIAKHSVRKLERLAPGSWINSDFGVWAGSKENNHNWYILKRIREQIDKTKDAKTKDRLMKYFYILEGSDWNWWNTFEDITGDFKDIFLSYIKKIYKILAKKPPSYIIK